MTEHKFRCGDTARIEGQTYDIEVSYADYASGRASWCGWPEGVVDIEKLALVETCSDDEHRKAVARWLDRPRSQERDHRRDMIESLYRPRAYWKRLVKSAREAAQEALAHVDRCETSLFASYELPEDVEPLQ